MSFVYSANQQPTSSPQVWYNLVSLLVSAGWSVPEAGDGTSYFTNPTLGTTITSASFSNANAWIRVQMPSGTGLVRSFVFQTISSTNVRIWYFGPNSTASGGNATTVPTCALSDRGSQELTSGTTNYVSTLNRVSYWADDSSPYGFGVHGWNTSGTPTFHLVLEALLPNTYHPLDQDPYVILYMPNAINGNFWMGQNSNALNSRQNSNIKCWVKYNMIGSGFQSSEVVIGQSASQWPGNYTLCVYTNIAQSTSIYDGKDEEFPMYYMRLVGTGTTQTNFGNADVIYFSTRYWKGTGTYVKQYGQSRAHLSTLSIGGTRDRIVYGHCTFPWNGSIPVVP